MTGSIRPRLRGVIAGMTAALLAATGTVIAEGIAAAPAAAAYPESVNPFAIAGGFTVYARDDAHLGNQETEGSIAVGDSATVQGSSGQYTIIHVAAGTGDYTLPTVDHDPTRFLVGSYSTSSTGILAITSAGTTEPSLLGDLKMVQRDGPWEAFARADWLRLNENPSNPDQTPLIDATHQTYPDDATPPNGSGNAAGNGSIYTVDTSADAVAGYVEANRDASWEEAAMCLADIADPTAGIGYAVGVAEDYGDRVVLDTLSPDQPNVVDYADIAGAALIQFSDGATPGAENPLVIRVPAGTTEVIGARADPQGLYSPYMLWDLSQLSGDVTVTAAQARIDGSIYAPEASVTVDAAPLDGQVIGSDVILLGGEVHSFLFAGSVPCSPDSGTFSVRKELSGIEASDLPEGTTFTVNYTATEPDGTVVPGTLEVPADGTAVDVGQQFPLGTVVDFEEVAPESIPGWDWTGATITPDPLTVGSGSADVVVANTAVELTGTFSIVKTVDDPSGGDPVFPEGTTVPVHWSAWNGLTQIDEGDIDVLVGGPVADVGQQFPVGTRIVLTEDLSGVAPPEGYEWSGKGWSPGRTFVIEDDGTTVAVELTNTVTPLDDGRTITVVKSATGTAADPAFGYAISYNTGPDSRATIPLPIGEPQLIDDVDPEADVLELAELVPTFNGTSVDPSDWEVPTITVTADGVSTEYTPANFEGDGALETAIVDIPLPESGDIEIDVANALREGTFDVSKAFENVPGFLIPDGTEFGVTWTATLPTGDVEEGVIRIPADGTPIGPVDDDGAAVLFPYGTVITLDELVAPAITQLEWGTRTFDPAELTIGADGSAVVHSTLTNTATVRTGTFEVSKQLAGIDEDELLVDSLMVDYVAFVPGTGPQTGSFAIPVDGTPAGPVDEAGDPIQFPVGTIINVVEQEPDPSALPPGYEWGESTWSPSSWVLIGLDDETPVLEVTNSVVAVTRYAVTKTVEGDAASAVPDGTTFAVDWWWDGDAQPSVQLTPGVTVYSPYFPVGSIIAVQEGDLPDVPGVEWGTPTWTLEGEQLSPDADGRYTLPMTAAGSPETAELTLTNTASTTPTPPTPPAPPLPATGGGAVSPLVPLGAFAAIALGAYLATRRIRRPHEN